MPRQSPTARGYSEVIGLATAGQLISLAVFAALTAMQVSPMLIGASAQGDQTAIIDHHADGAPCPDGGDSGPCDEECPCLCCPGHSTTAAMGQVEQPAGASPTSTNACWRSDDALSEGVSCRVFRPPRA